MIAVIFEVRPAEGQEDTYLAHASRLREELQTIDGFISVERFRSITDPDKVLSLSFFRDEAAIDEWRKLAGHRRAQSQGRHRLFADYHLRIAHVIRDYGKFDRAEVPADSLAVNG